MERVLIVDDDPGYSPARQLQPQAGRIRSLTAATGREALEAVQKHPPDLIILDVMLPDVDGMEVCRTLRSQEASRRIPIIMLTARGEEIDRVVGFELGADDYVMKPFSPRELVLRVKSILRRIQERPIEMLRLGEIQIYPERRQCFVGKKLVSLTVKEFDLLYELMRGARQRADARSTDGSRLGISWRSDLPHARHSRAAPS